MMTKLKLKNSEAALVFRDDGALEAVIPTVATDAKVMDRVMCTQALFWAYEDEKMMTQIADAFRAHLDGLARGKGPLH